VKICEPSGTTVTDQNFTAEVIKSILNSGNACYHLVQTSFFWPVILHHHQLLLLLVKHRASVKSFQALRSPAVPLNSFHDLPVFLISPSIVLRHVLFGLPLLLYPGGFQSNAVFSIAPASLRNVCPIQFHFLLFICISIGFCLVILHSSASVILSVHFICYVAWLCNLVIIQ